LTIDLKEYGDLLMKMEDAFGLVLKNMRNEQSISQEQLAHICQLDRTFISLLERGKRNPTLITIFKLADGLNVKPSVLISKTEKLITS